ncbi:RHS repeat domain-containing protein [Pseudomonas sp. SM4]|uniref:RHS repeat domain-containing protein n=1 Tax=Pseudomonas sp. SM4 TaxID=3424177 RepID=UPI003F7ADDFA
MNREVHQGTPSVTVNDGRGLPVRQVAYLRAIANEPAIALLSRQAFDGAGRVTRQWDSRLSEPNLSTVYGLNGAALKISSVDAGWRLSLPGLAGETLEHHDQRGNVWRTRYDQLLRVVAREENQQPNVETFVYADGSANALMNLRGQLLNQVDPSGRIDCESYAMTGALLRDTFTSPDNQSFTSARTYSPLSAVLAHLDAGGHQQQFRYDLAGQIQQVQLQLNAQATWQTVQLNAQYNAAGQVIEQEAGNGVTSRWQYAAADGRLHRHTARIGQQSPLQDSEYSYDRVGNITRIFDHTFTPTYFANQRVDGARDFSYDSLYRLLSASGYDDAVPRDNPGRPQPTDPNDRRNYVQTYTYDHGNNLVELRHVRDGANHTRRMRIDPNSNRGVRCNDNDPEPDFDTLFDRHGNQQMLQAGQPLQWNTRDQLEKITLVARDNLPDDEEFYEYSQGARVYKRHTHDGGKHFHAVRYLPGLEIRSKDNGEALHVITLATGIGSVRCLHWLTSPPSGVEQNQMRYTLEDHLGSSTMELDHQGRMISHEGYYSFGATAWMAARSLIEVAYKFIRYSGKEMDVSGLYYYGARYYAPWLQRWVSADPAGDVDGLNLYAFVGNNPIGFSDTTGLAGEAFQLPTAADWKASEARFFQRGNERQSMRSQQNATRRIRLQLEHHMRRQDEILGLTKLRMRDASGQLERMGSDGDVALATLRRTLVLLLGKGVSYGAGIAVGVGTQALGLVAPGVGNAIGVGMGYAAKIGVSAGVDYIAEKTGGSASVNLKTSKLSAEKIIRKAEHKLMNPDQYLLAKYQNMNPKSQKGQLKLGKEVTDKGASELMKATITSVPSEAIGAMSAGVGFLLALPEVISETLGALQMKSLEKMATFATNIEDLAEEIQSGMINIVEFQNALPASTGNDAQIQGLWHRTFEVHAGLEDLGHAVRSHVAQRKAAA